MNSPIGIFDSGLGGLTVARAIRETLPHEPLLYYGDTARVPYGSKSKETVIRFTRDAIDFLRSHNAKCIVIACNTASALALPELESRLTVPIIGVINPGADAAVQATRNGNIGVIATSATIASEAYTHAIRKRKPDATVYSQPCPLFVPLVEEGWTDRAATDLIIEEYLRTLRTAHIDTLVLGCTHYPLLHIPIHKYMGESVTLVDSASTCANTLARLLESNNLLNTTDQPAEEHFFVTDAAARFSELGAQFLGTRLQAIKVAGKE